MLIRTSAGFPAAKRDPGEDLPLQSIAGAGIAPARGISRSRSAAYPSYLPSLWTSTSRDTSSPTFVAATTTVSGVFTHIVAFTVVVVRTV